MAARLLIVAMVAGLAGAATAALPWGATRYTRFTIASGKTLATCQRVGEPRIPAADKPTAAERAALKGCDSEKLYYGIGGKPDHVAARKCAIIEAEGADDANFAGSTILMQVYANGYGVTRDPDLATAFACGLDGAPMEYDLRVGALQALKTMPGKQPFDYCDAITSGLGQGVCADHLSRQAAVGRNTKLTTLAASLPPAGRTAYQATRNTFDAYVEAYGDGEVDQSGTARAMLVTEAEDKVRDQFVKDMQRLKTGQWPAANAADAKSADAQLNASYKAALAWAGSKDKYGTVTAEGIRAAQRAWLPYRDAFVAFAAKIAPSVSRDAVLARLTRLRLAQLDTLHA